LKDQKWTKNEGGARGWDDDESEMFGRKRRRGRGLAIQEKNKQMTNHTWE
jgi:hypothetical protein